jgi:ABC-type bacteriocin/lantibiotic exporter with double-glycine peptidase domain
MRWPVLLLALASCHPARMTPEGEHSREARVIELPLVAEVGAGNGGLACARLLLRCHGLDLDAEALERFPSDDLALVTAVELRDYLRGRGLAAEVLGGELSEQPPRGVFFYLARGHPVALRLEDRFALVFGFDPKTRRVLVADPKEGRREIELEELDRLWRPSGRLMLLAA